MTYIPTEWKTGDVITAERLNKAEQGIKDAHDNVADISSEISTEVASWLDEHVNVTEGVNIDDTLSVAGSAADAAKVGEELGDLKSSFGKATASGEIADFQSGYYRLANSVTVLDFDTPEESSDYVCGHFDCNAGDTFSLTGRGASGAKLWAWCKSNGTILSRAAVQTETDLQLVAPEGAEVLVVNFQTAFDYSLEKINTRVFPDEIDAIEERVSAAESAISDEQQRLKNKADVIDVAGLVKVADDVRRDLQSMAEKMKGKADNNEVAGALVAIGKNADELMDARRSKAAENDVAGLIADVDQKADKDKTRIGLESKSKRSDVEELVLTLDEAEGEIQKHSSTIAGLQSSLADANTEINKRVSKPTDDPNGVSGQVLGSNGDGTTKWINPAVPSDAQVGSAVSAWIDDHPEAVTTVKDGSVSMQKLANDVLEAISDGGESVEANALASAMGLDLQAQAMQDADVKKRLQIYDEWQTKLLEYASYFAADGFGFLFFTDPHIMSGRYGATPTTMLQSLRYIKTVFANTPAQYVLCGGDWTNILHPLDEALLIGGRVPNLLREYVSERCYTLVGNHDGNWAYGIGTLTPTQLARIWFDSDVGYYKIESASTTCFAFDSEVDSGERTAYRAVQLHWFAESLLANTVPHLFGAIHIVKNVAEMEYRISYLADNLTKLAYAFNARTTITFDGISYDFSAASGTFHFLMGGHLHQDGDMTLNGIPVFLTNDFAEGASIDCCYADYDNAVMHMVRIGVGASRQFEIIPTII